jgi:hydroxyacylglutathione hydrolase
MREVVPEVWLLESPLRYAINAYLVGDVLIDCATRHSARRFRRELANRTVAEILLTHVHPDHQGLALALSQQYAAPVRCHEADLPVLRGEAPEPNRRWLPRLFSRLAGGPVCPDAEPLPASHRFAGFRVVHLPGHTAGSVVFLRDADGVAICGDVVMSWGWPGGRARLMEPFHSACDDVRENQRSIRCLWELQPRVLLPGHGPPVFDTNALEQLADRCRTLQPAPCPAR